MDSPAISFLPLHLFSVDDVFLPVNLDYFANLLPSVVPLCSLNFIILSDGYGSNVVLLSQLLEREDIISLRMWEGALKCLFQFLLCSEVTKGLNFMLASSVSAMATERKSNF